jgi:hypothetical protein
VIDHVRLLPELDAEPPHLPSLTAVRETAATLDLYRAQLAAPDAAPPPRS